MLKTIQPYLHNQRPSRLIIWGGVFLFLLLIIIVFRVYAAITLRKETLADAITVVRVMKAEQEKGVDKIILPGNVQAWHESPVFARTNGYVKKWYVDIGSRVKKAICLLLLKLQSLMRRSARQRQI